MHAQSSYHSGALRDSSGSYNSGFFLAGCFMIKAGVFFLLIQCIRQYLKRKRQHERSPSEQNKTATAMLRSVDLTLYSALEWQLGLPPSEELDGRLPSDEVEVSSL